MSRNGENPYSDQIEQIESLGNNNTNPELERLRLENENLRLQLLLKSQGKLNDLQGEIQNGNQFDNNNYITPNIDFRILGGKSIREELSIEHHGGLKFSKDKRLVEESIYNLSIDNINNNLGQFEISFKVGGKEYNILYSNGSNEMYLIQNGNQERIRIKGKQSHYIKFEDGNREIILKIKFNRNRKKRRR